MSLTATGTCKNLPRAKYLKFMIGQNEMYRLHKDADAVVKYYYIVDNFFEYPKLTGRASGKPGNRSVVQVMNHSDAQG